MENFKCRTVVTILLSLFLCAGLIGCSGAKVQPPSSSKPHSAPASSGVSAAGSSIPVAESAGSAVSANTQVSSEGGNCMDTDSADFSDTFTGTSSAASSAPAVVPFEKTKLGKYKYVWGDEFNGTTLDTSKWQLNANMGGYLDTELVKDNPNVLQVSDGCLKLGAIHYYDPANTDIHYAVTYSVQSQDEMNFQYGYLEIRARVPYKQGAWPSFWLLGDCSLGPRHNMDYKAEVDVFEVFSSLYEACPNIHKWYADRTNTQYKGLKKITNYDFASYMNLPNEYHVYGFEWTPTAMSMYIDGQKYMTFDLTVNYDGRGDMTGFQDPLYILFNNHLFTQQNPGWMPGWIVNNLDLPMEYWIDYVRLYQAPGQGGLYIRK